MNKNTGALFLELPPTKEWESVGLGKKYDEKCKVVYQRKYKDGDAYFLEFWNPEKEYGENCIVVPVSSTPGRLIPIYQGSIIRNVSNTTKDPNPCSNSWIALMREMYQKSGYSLDTLCFCSSQNSICQINYGKFVSIPHDHSGVICGAHVYVGDDRNNVYLVPLCNSHNHYSIDENTYFMVLAHNVMGLELINCIHA